MSFLPDGYGYVFLSMGGGVAVNIYLTINVALARKKYDVQYPALYAPTGHKYEKEFNSVQRAHQNTLESFSFVFLQTALCGLIYPKTSAIFASIYVLGRFIYGWGYKKYGPKGREAGAIITHLGDLPLTAIMIKIGYDLVMKK